MKYQHIIRLYAVTIIIKGGGWQGDNVGSQKNSVDGTGNYVGWQKNYVN